MWNGIKRGSYAVSQFKPIKITIGVLILLAGLVGLIAPVIPGFLLIFIGLVWLGIIERDDIKNWLARVRRK